MPADARTLIREPSTANPIWLAEENHLWGSAADSRRTAQARNRRLRTHGVAVPGGAGKEALTDLAYIPRESPRPIQMPILGAVTVRPG